MFASTACVRLSAPTRLEAPKLPADAPSRDGARISTGAIRPNVMTLSNRRAPAIRVRGVLESKPRRRWSAEEAASRSEPKRSCNARHTTATSANSDRALFAALASPHGLRQNVRC